MQLFVEKGGIAALEPVPRLALLGGFTAALRAEVQRHVTSMWTQQHSDGRRNVDGNAAVGGRFMSDTAKAAGSSGGSQRYAPSAQADVAVLIRSDDGVFTRVTSPEQLADNIKHCCSASTINRALMQPDKNLLALDGVVFSVEFLFSKRRKTAVGASRSNSPAHAHVAATPSFVQKLKVASSADAAAAAAGGADVEAEASDWTSVFKTLDAVHRLRNAFVVVASVSYVTFEHTMADVTCRVCDGVDAKCSTLAQVKTHVESDMHAAKLEQFNGLPLELKVDFMTRKKFIKP